MSNYRVTTALEVEITASRPLTEGEVLRVAHDVVELRIGPGIDNRIVAVGMRSDPSVSIEEAWCASMTRRNTVDGRLYHCSMAPLAAIHWSVEACEADRNGPCENPAEHHDYVSPGWDSPVPDPAPVGTAS